MGYSRLCIWFRRRLGGDDVNRASDGVVGDHGVAYAFLELNGTCCVGKAHPVVPVHIAGGQAGNRYSVEQHGDILLLETADVDFRVPEASGLGAGVHAGYFPHQFGIAVSGGFRADFVGIDVGDPHGSGAKVGDAGGYDRRVEVVNGCGVCRRMRVHRTVRHRQQKRQCQ